MDLSLIYLTCPDDEVAARIGRTLVEERLVACANRLPGVRSTYRWEGAIEEATEVVVLLKCPAALVPAVESRIRQLHPYTTPCVIEIPLGRVAAGFAAWVVASTGPDLPGHGPIGV